MNENDVQDQEVLDYVRTRMAVDMPPEFTRDVMNDVQRSDQRRRGFGWPIFTGLATVAAAVAVVVIGLGLLDRDEGVGSEPTPSPTASAAPSMSSTPEPSVPEASASTETTPSGTAEPTSGEGEFGPIHSMDLEQAFENGESCQVTNVITTVDTETDIGWTISFPEGWYTNEQTDDRSACTLFASEPIEFAGDGTYPQSVEIVGNVPPGGDFSTGGEITRTDEYTVDGVAAVRYEVAASEGGFSPDPAVLWAIAIAGNLPAEGNDRPYLILSTGSSDPDELAMRVDVLDRMVATLDFDE
jgi:hypothetical protein